MTPLNVLLAVGAACWLAFQLADRLLTHRVWWWATTDVLPPPVHVLVPVCLLAGAAAGTGGPRGWTAAAAVASLALGARHCGLSPRALRGLRRPAADGIRVVCWNTEHWDEEVDTEAFYAFLRRLDADVYLLQEHIYDAGVHAPPVPVDFRDRLEREFPGHHVLIRGQFVTLSRFPVVATPDIGAPEVFRVDLRVDSLPGAPVLSTYNVHLPVHVFLENPFRAALYREIRDRLSSRNRQLDRLIDDLRANGLPAVVAGDFNLSRSQGDIARLSAVATDALRACASLYPVSWHRGAAWLRWWRLDLAFTSRGASAERYAFRDPEGLSDHAVQELTLTVRKDG
ncbi:endonuclease/exonuclease/phosphatase family protein [Streptomyces sp. NPDC046831]|uniref:endonuclease/exonuclease/phosphatase family protein n=1 Tax=Streptomyces sp. NPDC046831 TaxID=3154805 RepID=UPI0033CD7DDD